MAPKANTWAMTQHLDAISRNVAEGAHAVVVVDGAGWHGALDLAVPRNVSLLTLPPYSPELNSIENVWQYLRQNFLSNREFEDYDAIVDACCKAWLAFIAAPDVVRSVAGRSWAKVSV